MADICFICDKPLSDGKNIIVERGLQTLKDASINRGDGYIEHLQNVNYVKVHSECRKNYTRKSSIETHKRRKIEEMPSTSQCSPRKKRTDAFNFETLCFFCAEPASEEAEIKKEKKYRRTIRKVSTLSFKDTVMNAAEARGDRYGRIVRDRINFEFDLVAAGAQYHSKCFDTFLVPPVEGEKGRPLDEKITVAMEDIFYYIENHEDCQFTLTELKDVLKDYIPSDASIIANLIQRYGKNIVVTTKPRSMTIICFRDTQSHILSKAWYENRKAKPEEERLRIIEAAAAIIREDIRVTVVNTEFYPPPSEMFNNMNAEIPKSLLFLIEEIILKHKKGKKENFKTKCTAISHAIMSAVRPRSFSSQLLVGISVFLHRKYGSKRLLHILSNLGFSASYKEAVLYEVSAVFHPQPTILPPTSGTLVQYAGDNADINVYTIDGHNTLHVMGIIKLVTPKSAVICNKPIAKCIKMPSAKDLAAISHVPLLTYENRGVSGLSKIEVQDISYEEVSTEAMFSIVDLLWMYGKWKGIPGLPGWNGFVECLTKKNRNFSTSQIMFLPFIHHPASNYNTIYTTLKYVLDDVNIHKQKTCIVTFDQPLYIKAREIVAACETDSDLSKIIIRLGGFHMLMSFLGCIGNIMAGSGIKEVLSVIYAPNSVEKMLNGHAFSRSVRGHTLLCMALSTNIFEGMEMNDNLYNFIDGYIENIMNGTVPYENIEESRSIFEPFMKQFQNKLNEFKARGPTAQLWLQYLGMVSIAHDFIRAERLGNWTDHLKAVKRMLPYFHAAGHFLYAKSTHLYLQDMLAIEQSMDPLTFEKFTKGFFTIKRSNKFNSGSWTDMVIEQTLMKSMKAEGGVSRGRSTEESVLCKWIYGMYAMNAVCDEIEKFCNVSFDSVDQHVDIRDSRIQRDNDDIQKLVEWFNLHNPFPSVNQIVSLATGITGNDKINCHDACDIGLQSMQNIIGQKFNKIILKRSNRVLSLLSVNSSMEVHGCKVAIDPLLLFQRISLNKRFDEHLREYLQYELSPYPTSLFDNTGMRKTKKSVLYKCVEPVNIEIDTGNVTYVIDGEFLLHRVIWQKDDTFLCVLNRYVTYLQNNFDSNIVVVFDGYSDNSKNIKAMEQLRRTAAISGSFEIIFDESMEVPISQEKFLSNRLNKNRLIAMLIQKLEAVNITTKQARDDADVLIIETAMEMSIVNTTVVVGEDIDFLILLIARANPHQQIFFMKPSKGNIETKYYNCSSIDKHVHCKQHILFLHAITGCDTTSALFNKGKLNAIKMFEKRPDLHPSAEVFQQENCPPHVIIDNGIRFILAMCGAPISENSIDNYRYLSFAKMTRLNTPVKLSSLPPTAAATQQHLYRVYYQVQTWLGKDVDPENWGWVLNNNILEPITTLLPPAPDVLLNTIFCNCAKGCGANCGCRKIGLTCSIVCGNCNGQSCFNAAPDATSVESFDNFDNTEYDEINPIDLLASIMIEDGDNSKDDDQEFQEHYDELPIQEMDKDEDKL